MSVSGIKGEPRFELVDGLDIFLYISACPCGDASMELSMLSQDDNSPWERKNGEIDSSFLRGRAGFSELGKVRTKPGRPDSPLSLSKSCSDKLSAMSFTSIFSSLTLQFISPERAYINAIILPGDDINVQTVDAIAKGWDRAFSSQGRLLPLEGCVSDGGFNFNEIKCILSSVIPPEQLVPKLKKQQDWATSDKCALYVKGKEPQVIIEGVRSGCKAVPPKYENASMVCRAKMFEVYTEIAHILGQEAVHTYGSLKLTKYGVQKQNAKEHVRTVLQNWEPSSGDSDFTLEQVRALTRKKKL